MPRSLTHKKPYFLDVAEYITTETCRYVPSPTVNPVQNETNEVKTPFNIPSVLEFEGNHLSPYLKQLLQNENLEFYDFTLEGEQAEDYYNEDGVYLGRYEEDSNGVILEDEAENEKSEEYYGSNENPNNEEENCYVEPSKLNLKTFRAIMAEFANIELSEEETRQFIYDYLLEEQLERAEEMSTREMVEAAEHNLRPLGPISWLERKNKVGRYLQKKKKRIWNKKINYDCRKKVAENRLRIKGKFVTPEQAFSLLGIQEDATMTMTQIRLMLDEKFRG